jgi:hypothetical protein
MECSAERETELSVVIGSVSIFNFPNLINLCNLIIKE